ncbi:putative transporter [Aspergillus tanneri]|uniref:Uncharacterized protein n=1 Tax=Aspergillus tanneri TaxID=1220188 RepID=A0A5M9M8K0_9EURO|nr:uncharacterized protein ATNIH1004_009920 [Aspergillus tanneri]KAA8643158.1 hypothetical protein ATNIH1004_009920 [Aspergillus tanneri]
MRASLILAGGGSEDPSTSETVTRGVRIPNSYPPLEPNFGVRRSPAGYSSYAADDSDFQRSRSASFSVRFRQVGGVNSIDNFARSWQRAAGFPEILPRRSSYVAVDSDEERRSTVNDVIEPQESDFTRPLLGIDGESEDSGPIDRNALPRNVFGSSLDRSLGTSYGTISSRVSEAT